MFLGKGAVKRDTMKRLLAPEPDLLLCRFISDNEEAAPGAPAAPEVSGLGGGKRTHSELA